MFGPVQKIAGAYRAYPVRDRVTKHDVLESVRSVQPHTVVHTLQLRDLRTLEPQSTVVAVNPAGRQSHLVLTTLGGRSATFLVHMPSQSVDLVPIRFVRPTHDKCTVLKCTVCTRDRVIVINDVNTSPSTEQLSVSERLRRVHDMVHAHHIPDAAIFPLRIVARRCFSLAQMPELKRFLARDNVRYHSLAVISQSHMQRELRVQVDASSAGWEARDKAPRSRAIGDVVDAPVVAAQGPDSYKFRIDPASDWEYLVVRTMGESTALDRLDLSTPTVCRLMWDGTAWRIAFTLPREEPAHVLENSEDG